MTAPIFAGGIEIDGDSAQNALGNTVSGDLVQVQLRFTRGRPAMFLGKDEVAARLACYVPAHNHETIVKELRANRAVAVSGPRGSGRETTAMAAIQELHPGIQVRRFSLEDDDAEEIYARGPCCYLIHAEDGGLARLSGCAEAIRESGGYLAVITADETSAAAASIRMIRVEHPRPVQVYRSWVTALGMVEWVDWHHAAALLENSLPTDARRLADLVERLGQQGGGLKDRQAEVTLAYRGWDEEIRQWFRNHSEPHERALLVAAATVPAAATEAYVYDAASALADQLHVDVNGRGLAWCSVTELREVLDAKQADGQVIFERTGYASSILRHVLANYLLARDDIFAWLVALPTGQAARHEIANTVTETYADLAAEYGTAAAIRAAARQWGVVGLADLAFIALSRTCLHPRVGQEVRQTLYDWSIEASTRQTLKLTIARVCEPLGQTYPSVALTRLKHLATHGNLQVVGEVLTTARALLDQGHREEVVKAATDWCAPSNRENLSDADRRRRRRAGALLFLDLAEPIGSFGLPEILDGARAMKLEACEQGWHAVLDSSSIPGARTRDMERVLHQWLTTSLSDALTRRRISALFVAAALRPRSPAGNRAAAPRIPAATQFMIDAVERWSAISPDDADRMAVEESIVIPLTRPWWLRLRKIINLSMRRLSR
jgi:hypothetical protein